MDYPKYISHKEVSAAKIAAIDPGADGSLTLHLEGGFDNVVIPHQDVKHKPQPEAGWYLIRYADGYVSFSPEDVFEEGYTLLQDPGVAEVTGVASIANDASTGIEALPVPLGAEANEHQTGIPDEALPGPEHVTVNEVQETSTAEPPAVVA